MSDRPDRGRRREPVRRSGRREPPLRARPPGLDGILVVDKPAGPTSHDVVALVRRLAATRRVGHGGTLDPFAAGVLPLFLGHATRVVEYHMADPKAYRATVCFGASSTTDDLEGELTPATGPGPDRAAVESALASFVGEQDQRPPAFSAIKVAGRRAYAMARAGTAPELATRRVIIHRLALVGWHDADLDRPIAEIEVDCSAGTYVRALARDLGEALGGGAYLGGLVRTASGPFGLEAASPLDAVRDAAAAGPDALKRRLLPIDAGLDRFDVVRLDATDIRAVRMGQVVRASGAGEVPGRVATDAAGPIGAVGGERSIVRVVGPDGRLVAIAQRRGDRLYPDKVLVGPDADG